MTDPFTRWEHGNARSQRLLPRAPFVVNRVRGVPLWIQMIAGGGLAAFLYLLLTSCSARSIPTEEVTNNTIYRNVICLAPKDFRVDKHGRIVCTRPLPWSAAPAHPGTCVYAEGNPPGKDYRLCYGGKVEPLHPAKPTVPLSNPSGT